MSTLKTRLSAKPNATKHGAFSHTAILPGEDPQEFHEIMASLVTEWQPDGRTEMDAVLTMAQGMWGNNRMEKFLQAKAEAASYDPQHPLFNEEKALAQFYFVMERAPDQFNRCLDCLSTEHADHLRQNFPPTKFKSIPEWLKTIRKEIFELITKSERLGQAPTLALLDRSSQLLTLELMANVVAVKERMNALIERGLKRLIYIKATKQALDRRSAKHSNQESGSNIR